MFRGSPDSSFISLMLPISLQLVPEGKSHRQQAALGSEVPLVKCIYLHTGHLCAECMSVQKQKTLMIQTHQCRIHYVLVGFDKGIHHVN